MATILDRTVLDFLIKYPYIKKVMKSGDERLYCRKVTDMGSSTSLAGFTSWLL